MPTNIALELTEDNDEDLAFEVFKKDAAGAVSVLNLATATVNFYLKTSASQEDAAAVKYSNSPATGVTVTDAAAGKLEVALNKADIAATGTLFYKLDVVIGGRTHTAAFGNVTVQDV